MINPIYGKILNVICKSSCNTTCDKCYQCANSCAKYAEYSKLSISLGKSGLFSLDKANIPNVKDIVNIVQIEREIYKHALYTCACALSSLRANIGLGNENVDELVNRYYFVSKEVINGRKRKNEQMKI